MRRVLLVLLSVAAIFTGGIHAQLPQSTIWCSMPRIGPELATYAVRASEPR